MQHQGTFMRPGELFPRAARQLAATAFSRYIAIGLLLVVALLAFEVFNFDTTQYALSNLLGDVSFFSVRWATILAFAFCAIDFAGLAHLFTPERGRSEPREVWYLMGAWLLGATMNALMTWWAINLTLLEHPFGNEVLSREQLLNIVPVFVAVLVWLTRILFIGAFSVAGDHLFHVPALASRPSTVDQHQARTQPVFPLAARVRATGMTVEEQDTASDKTPALVRRPRPAGEQAPSRQPLGEPRGIRPGPLPAGMHAAPRRRR